MTRCSAITLRRLLTVVAAIVMAAFVAGGAPSELVHGLEYLLPPLLLLLALAARRYPGERALLAVMHRRRGRRLRADLDPVAHKPGPRAALPRGGRLIASSLAVRPPPALIAAPHA